MLQDESPRERRVLRARVVEADDDRHLPAEDRLHRRAVERGMRGALVEHQLHPVVRHVHDVAEDRERPTGIGHRRDLRRHHHDQALGPLDHRKSGLGQRGPQVDDDHFLPGHHNVKNAPDALPGKRVDLLRTQRPGQDAHTRAVIDDVAAQDSLEIHLGRLGGARDRSRGDQVGEERGVAEWCAEVDQENLARELASQGRRAVDRQCCRAGPAFGGEERDKGRGRAGGALSLARRRGG